MSIKRRLLEGFLFIFGGRVGAGLISVLITPIIVRILGSGGYGDYAFALAVYSTLRTVSGGGIYEAARKHIAETSDPVRRSAVFRYYLNIAVVFGLSVAFLLVGGTYVLVGTIVLEERLRIYLFLVAVLVGLHPFFYLVRSTLMGYELERYSEPLIVLNKVLLALVGVPLAFVGLHVTGMLVGHIVALAVLVLLGSFAIHRSTAISLRGTRLPFSSVSELYDTRMFRYSALTVVFVLLTKSLYTVDIILLQPLTSSEVVGYYRASLFVAEFLWFVPYAIQIALLHSMSTLWAEDRIDEIETISSTIVRYTLLLVALLAIVLVAIGESLLPVYFGPEFAASYLPMLLLLPGAICFAIARPIYAIGQGHGNIRLLVISTGGAAALNLVLNLVLIPPYGMFGAAVATSIGYGSMVFLHNWAAGLLGFHPLRNVRFWRLTTTALVTLSVILLVDAFVRSTLVTLAVVPLLTVAVFGFLAFGTGAITTREVRELRRMLAGG